MTRWFQIRCQVGDTWLALKSFDKFVFYYCGWWTFWATKVALEVKIMQICFIQKLDRVWADNKISKNDNCLWSLFSNQKKETGQYCSFNTYLCPTPLSPSGKDNKGQSCLQKYCKGACRKKTKWRCSNCNQEQAFCHPRFHGNNYFRKHCQDFHTFDICQISRE